jgi:polyhydroxyalkanoate synthesis regulator phasin
MKAKTLIELLTLSTNIYMITKDEKLMNNLSEMTQKGKAKLGELIDEFGGENESEEKLMEKLMHKAHQAKEEFEHKMEEVARKVYDKVNIAHTDQIKDLETRIEQLRGKLSMAEDRLALVENPRK